MKRIFKILKTLIISKYQFTIPKNIEILIFGNKRLDECENIFKKRKFLVIESNFFSTRTFYLTPKLCGARRGPGEPSGEGDAAILAGARLGAATASACCRRYRPLGWPRLHKQSTRVYQSTRIHMCDACIHDRVPCTLNYHG